MTNGAQMCRGAMNFILGSAIPCTVLRLDLEVVTYGLKIHVLIKHKEAQVHFIQILGP